MNWQMSAIQSRYRSIHKMMNWRDCDRLLKSLLSKPIGALEQAAKSRPFINIGASLKKVDMSELISPEQTPESLGLKSNDLIRFAMFI